MNEEQELDRMSNDELAAYWNVLQAGKRMIQAGDVEKLRRHEPIVDRLLTARNIPHEAGKRINRS